MATLKDVAVRHGASQGSGGRQAAALLVAAGLLTLVNNYLPGSEHLDVALLDLVAVLAVLAGIASWFVPWGRLPRWTTLLHVPVALGLIGGANLLGGVSAYSYAIYFVVLFVWVGLAHPPRTSWLLVPPAAFAYVVPLLLRDDTPTGGVSSATVAIPVCVLVAETIARTARRREVAQEEAMRRAELSERLAHVVTEVNAVLDPDESIARICEGVRLLVGATGAGFVVAEGGWASVVEVAGVPRSMVGFRYETAGTAIDEVVRTGRRVVVHDFSRYLALVAELPALIPGLHEIVAVPVRRGGAVTGALYAVVGGDRGPLAAAELDALEALAGHVAAAVRNGETYGELVRRRAHEQAVVDGMADGLAVVGPDGRVLTWNAAAERLTGIPAVEAVGRPLPFPVGTAGPEARRAGGRWLETVASPLAEGELVVGIRDISKSKALDEAKDLFLATTSHELRTPLTVVKGFTETLRERWDDLSEEERAESLRVIAARTDALIDLVDHLLLGTKADASRESLTPVPMALEPVLQEAALEVGGLSVLPVVTVEAGPGVAVLADPVALAQVLDQLLDNAVKYSPDGGPVELRARNAGPCVVVTVADRGIGLPPGGEHTVFDRFVQGERGDRRQFGGVGLGLHIVRTLVEAMHGEVAAAPREGGGAEFSFSLPAAPALPRPREAPARDRDTAG